MATEQRWLVSIEITPANVTAFRTSDRPRPSLSKPIWLRGTLILHQGARVGLISSKDRRVGRQVFALWVPAHLSADDGVAPGSTSFFSQYVTVLRRASQVRVRMTKAQAGMLLQNLRASVAS